MKDAFKIDLCFMLQSRALQKNRQKRYELWFVDLGVEFILARTCGLSELLSPKIGYALISFRERRHAWRKEERGKAFLQAIMHETDRDYLGFQPGLSYAPSI